MEKRNKLWALILTGALLLISYAYYSANVYYMYLVVYIWFGVSYGMMLQYGRFCFASASRDLFAAGVPRMAVGILIALMFFSLIEATLETTHMSTFHPAPFGIHMLIAGSIFGVGMVLAGGCASGSLYKVGEGNVTSLLAVVFGLCLGQAVFVDLGGIFTKLAPQSWIDSAHATQAAVQASRGLEMPISSWFDHYLVGYVWKQPTYTWSGILSGGNPTGVHFFLGNALINAILPALLILVVIYRFYPRKGYITKLRKEKGSTGLGDELAGIWKMITASKRTSIMGVLVGITAGLHILTMKGMQLKFNVKSSNFGELLNRMGHTADTTPKGTVFDPTGISQARKDRSAHGYLRSSAGTCTTICSSVG
jgi:uncharacterized membrane protein YedE/YeeE